MQPTEPRAEKGIHGIGVSNWKSHTTGAMITARDSQEKPRIELALKSVTASRASALETTLARKLGFPRTEDLPNKRRYGPLQGGMELTIPAYLLAFLGTSAAGHCESPGVLRFIRSIQPARAPRVRNGLAT